MRNYFFFFFCASSVTNVFKVKEYKVCGMVCAKICFLCEYLAAKKQIQTLKLFVY